MEQIEYMKCLVMSNLNVETNANVEEIPVQPCEVDGFQTSAVSEEMPVNALHCGESTQINRQHTRAVRHEVVT